MQVIRNCDTAIKAGEFPIRRRTDFSRTIRASAQAGEIGDAGRLARRGWRRRAVNSGEPAERR
ncbi:hypothetical protein A3727_25615 [Erythrobacter sp. HI0038]|nr:hypothetical protein A3727_25615 [Erythrobacter sp. HI0038]